ncbi:MAG TPA: M28 family peptidase [Terriglobia bacterium]|nr:M28 family peptidase [Terriglobia bacterium]
MPKRQANRPRLAVCSFLLLLAVPNWLVAQGPAGTFNGGRAFEDLKHLVSYGPRPAGSPALAEARRWIITQLKETGAEVEEDSFTASTPVGAIPMTNLIAKFPGEHSNVVMVTGHYDTKLFENFRFVGANDGASSAALLLELARELRGRRHALTYWLVFFDGEEAVRDWSATDSVYGSRHLVQKLSSDGKLGRIKAMILVDMIGDSHLVIHRDANSTPWLQDIIFTEAHRLGYAKNFLDSAFPVDDDHIPFVNAGVAAVDLISEFSSNDGYWHTARDTVDHCSPLSLTIVGRVVLATLDDLDHSK